MEWFCISQDMESDRLLWTLCWTLQVHKRNYLDQQNLFSLSERTLWHVIRFCILSAANTRFSPISSVTWQGVQLYFQDDKMICVCNSVVSLNSFMATPCYVQHRVFFSLRGLKAEMLRCNWGVQEQKFRTLLRSVLLLLTAKNLFPTGNLTFVSCVMLCLPSVCHILRRRLKCIALL